MFKKTLALFLALALIFCLGACGGKGDDVAETSSVEAPVEKATLNPLTGLEISKTLANNKATAVTINNLNSAQKVQTGLGKFDVVYEVPVEGGITRILALTNDISALPQIGTVRSARQVFMELAYGHNANYVHAGYDYYHFVPLKTRLGVESFDINTGKYAKYGFRQSNGLSSEHTMYTKGSNLSEGFAALGWEQTTDDNSWIEFLDKETVRVPETAATKLMVTFSASYKTGFTYNAETKEYRKQYKDGTDWKDYLTGETAEFTNVFVLFTEVGPHNCTGSDNKGHTNVELKGGKGYYFTNGAYEEIVWEKGNAGDKMRFFTADGATALEINAGQSYICITSADATVTIE